MGNKGKKIGNHRFEKYQSRQIQKQRRKNTLQIIFSKQKQSYKQVGKNQVAHKFLLPVSGKK